MTLESLQKQKADTENELECAKAAVYRCDGALQLLKHLITLAETPETTDSPASE